MNGGTNMNKKIIVTFIIAILIIIVCIIAYIVLQNNGTENNEQLNKESSTNKQNSMEEQKNNQINESEKTNNSKIAVIYFSATGTTEKIAKYISEETNADLVRIEPKETYTSADLNYNSDCRANKEQNDENSRPEIKNKIYAQDYDVIYLGYPIWWGTVPRIILTFLDSYNLDGKTVIPFCTSGSTSISQSQSTLEAYNKNIKWLKGKRFNSSTSESDIKEWIKELDISKEENN